MLVFGGASTKCFKMDMARAAELGVTLQATKAQLLQEAPISTQYTSVIGTSFFGINQDSSMLYVLDMN